MVTFWAVSGPKLGGGGQSRKRNKKFLPLLPFVIIYDGYHMLKIFWKSADPHLLVLPGFLGQRLNAGLLCRSCLCVVAVCMSGSRTRFSKYTMSGSSRIFLISSWHRQKKKKKLCYVCSDHQNVAKYSRLQFKNTRLPDMESFETLVRLPDILRDTALCYASCSFVICKTEIEANSCEPLSP